jgi:predicted nucleic acid-binding protein
MAEASDWFACRIGFVEVSRAIALTAGQAAVRSFTGEWPSFTVIEVDQDLVEQASQLAADHQLRSLDALHLAAALLLSSGELVLATWDRRLHRAARAAGLQVLPDWVEE